jgi:hypothetical protein
VAPVSVVRVVFTVVSIVIGELTLIVVIKACVYRMFTTITSAAHNLRLEFCSVIVSTPAWVLCIFVAPIAVVVSNFVVIFIQIEFEALSEITLLESIVLIIRLLLFRLRFLLLLRF